MGYGFYLTPNPSPSKNGEGHLVRLFYMVYILLSNFVTHPANAQSRVPLSLLGERGAVVSLIFMVYFLSLCLRAGVYSDFYRSG